MFDAAGAGNERPIIEHGLPINVPVEQAIGDLKGAGLHPMKTADIIDCGHDRLQHSRNVWLDDKVILQPLGDSAESRIDRRHRYAGKDVIKYLELESTTDLLRHKS